MKKIKLISWNVNGIRAIYKKNFMDWFNLEKPDMLCIQETKAHPEQLDEILINPNGYYSFFSSAEKKGYSGVALYSKDQPKEVKHGIGITEFDSEGRIISADYQQFLLLNIYFPNGKQSKQRLKYKMDFYDAFLDFVIEQKNKGKNLIICGDVNTAHKEIDLARPKENQKTSGFLPEERVWIDKLIGNGFVDTLRIFHAEAGLYSWWDMRTCARERDIGWRIDYFYVNDEFKNNIKSAFILKDVMGSDHCPIGIEIEV